MHPQSQDCSQAQSAHQQNLPYINLYSDVHHELRRHSMKAVVKKKGPTLTAARKHACLEFAKAHEH
ncbi:hypothetical protein BD414DRAFT_416748 [Trametes punicea]|nr:hypothetical protein BD414DRAFT_416748 [Trametes punicea]